MSEDRSRRAQFERLESVPDRTPRQDQIMRALQARDEGEARLDDTDRTERAGR